MEGTEENAGTKSTEENKGRNGRRKGIKEWKEETYIYNTIDRYRNKI